MCVETEEEIPRSISSRRVSHQHQVVGADARWFATSGGCRPSPWWFLHRGEGMFPGTLPWPHSVSDMVVGCLLLGWFCSPGLSKVLFLQEGAYPGSPRAPGAGAHQKSGDFSASLSCVGEPWWWGGQRTLRWNWCPSDHQLLLKQNQNSSWHPPSSYAASTAWSKICYPASLLCKCNFLTAMGKEVFFWTCYPDFRNQRQQTHQEPTSCKSFWAATPAQAPHPACVQYRFYS